MSPYEILHGKRPRCDRLRSFGCLCYATTLVRENKFSTRAKKCIYIGNSTTQNGYILYEILKGDVTISRDVTVCEEDFPFNKMNTSIITSSNSTNDPNEVEDGILQPPIIITDDHPLTDQTVDSTTELSEISENDTSIEGSSDEDNITLT